MSSHHSDEALHDDTTVKIKIEHSIALLTRQIVPDSPHQDGNQLIHAYGVSDFPSPTNDLSIRHLNMRFRATYNRSMANLLNSEEASSHTRFLRHILRDILGATVDELQFHYGTAESNGRTFDNRVGVAQTIDRNSNWTYMDIGLPEWDLEMVDVLKTVSLDTATVKCQWVVNGPCSPANYVLMRTTVPSVMAYDSAIVRFIHSWESWRNRHNLSDIVLLAAGGEFDLDLKSNLIPRCSDGSIVYRQVPCEQIHEGSLWNGTLYMVFKVPEERNGEFNPEYSRLLPGFTSFANTFDTRSMVNRLEARNNFPFRKACSFCKSMASHLYNEKFCWCTVCCVQGHHKTSCKIAQASIKITSRTTATEIVGQRFPREEITRIKARFGKSVDKRRELRELKRMRFSDSSPSQTTSVTNEYKSVGPQF